MSCRRRRPSARNLAKIGAQGLAFDVCMLARQLPIALDLARACRLISMLVLDHCGVPDIAGGSFDAMGRRASLPLPPCPMSM
ncbi:MAG: hypothetical protein V9G14_14435 [Cypionkella sp.]